MTVRVALFEVMPETVAVINVVPIFAAEAVAIPWKPTVLLTVAIDGSDEFHVTDAVISLGTPSL